MNQTVRVDTVSARVREMGAMLPGELFAPVLLRGQDALDLIHRISTNDLRRCQPGIPVATVFTTEKGRIIDRVEAVRLREEVWLLCHKPAAEKVKEWISRYIITEEVELPDVTLSFHVCSIAFHQASSSIPPAGGGPETGIVGTWNSTFGPFSIRRYLVTSGSLPALEASVREAGIAVLTVPEYHALRVLAGVPSYPEELNEGHNPLEAGLRADVSFTKGCYIGQEVIARLDSYEKVQRALTVLTVRSGDDEIPEGAGIMIGEDMVGVVTSRGGTLGPGGDINVMGYVEKGVKDREGLLSVQTAAGPKPARIHGSTGTAEDAGSTPG